MTLDEALEKKGWTAYQLSKETKISEYQLSRIRNGKASIGGMSAKNVLAIADALDVDFRELINDGRDDRSAARIAAKRKHDQWN